MPSNATRLISAPNLRWLFAETLVIVLGVLIALALNDFWTDRQERRLEVLYLERLEAEFNGDLGYIQRVYQPGLERKKAALEAILPVVRGDEPVPKDPMVFLEQVAIGGALSGSQRLEISLDATYRDLQATGNLRLIQDDSIRSRIINYYGSMTNQSSRIAGRNSGYVMFVHSAIPAELRDDIDLAAVERMGLEHAIRRLTSEEFRAIVNAEYNKMLLMSRMPFEEEILATLEAVATYRESL